MIVQIILLCASLFAATAKLPWQLRAYLWMATGLALIELLSFSAGYGIDSKMYGFMWGLYNFGMLSFATAYAKPSLKITLLSLTVFFTLGFPPAWYLWLTDIKGAWCMTLGITLVIDAAELIPQTMGFYWATVAVQKYIFTMFDGSHWHSNLWLPSLLSITCYLMVGTAARLWGGLCLPTSAQRLRS